jgi:hypothetical protein
MDKRYVPTSYDEDEESQPAESVAEPVGQDHSQDGAEAQDQSSADGPRPRKRRRAVSTGVISPE